MLSYRMYLYTHVFVFDRRVRDAKGGRYHWQAKMITSTCDLSPRGLVNVNRILRSSDDVLRFFTIKVKKSGLNTVRSRKRSNPFIHGKHTYKPEHK